MSSRLQPTHPRKKRSGEGSRNRSKVVLDVDLNAYPDESSSAVGVSAEASGTAVSKPSSAAAKTRRNSVQQARLPIDVDAIDDDVVMLSSPRRTSQVRPTLLFTPFREILFSSSFCEAFGGGSGDKHGIGNANGYKVPNRSRRSTPAMVFLDDDSDVHHTSDSSVHEQSKRLNLNVHARGTRNLPIETKSSMLANCEILVDVQSSPNAKRKKVASESEPQKKKQKEPTFSCAVCWGELVDETSTICGHIFCQECIKNAIKAQKKCPTCRRTLNMKNIHRVYLPTAK